jgi:hypothetical protein
MTDIAINPSPGDEVVLQSEGQADILMPTAFNILFRKADRWIAPVPRGDQSGVGWENAAPISALSWMPRQGRNILLLADEGPYTAAPATISQSGVDGNPCRIQGVDRFGNAAMATFVGNRTTKQGAVWVPPSDPLVVTNAPLGGANGDTGAGVFTLNADVSYLTFSHLRFERCGYVFQQKGECRGAVLEDIEAEFIRGLWEQDSPPLGSTWGRNDFIARRITVDGFSKQCFDLKQGDNNVYEDIYLNSHRITDDNFAIGLAIGYRRSDYTEGVVTNVLVRTSQSWKDQGKQNYIGNCYEYDASYTQGDGIAAERGVSGMVVEDTYFENCGDGGIDDKSNGGIARRCSFKANKANIRIWNNGLYEDCIFDWHKSWGAGGWSAVILATGSTSRGRILRGVMPVACSVRLEGGAQVILESVTNGSTVKASSDGAAGNKLTIIP